MDEILTVDEVARYLRVHPMTVQRWCRSGNLPAAKIGRAYRIKKTDLEAWWDKRTPRGEALDTELKRSPKPAAVRKRSS